MSRWMLAALSLTIALSAARAEDGSLYGRIKKNQDRAKSSDVIVVSGETAARITSGTPVVVVSGEPCLGDDCSPRRRYRTPPQCESCQPLSYNLWFAFSSCESFFGLGSYAPSWPDGCPNCCRKR